MIKRLKIKFVCINMAIVMAMLCLIFTLVIFFMGVGMEMQGERAMQQITENALRPSYRTESRQDIRRPYFTVQMGLTGEVLVIDRGYFEKLDESELLEYTRAALAQETDTGTLKEHKLRFQKIVSPLGQTIVFADMSTEVAAIEHLIKTCGVISILSFGLFLTVSILLARWAVKPVEKAWNQQRQFVADASHELKTPLTVIMTNAELLQSPGYDDQERGRFADSILTMSRQMRGLVESLLELARVDNGAAKMTFSAMDLSELVSDCLLPFEPVFFEKALLLESRIEEGLRVKGSQSHLRQVVDILLDNAAKYSSPGGTTLVTLKRQGNHCLLTVASPGGTISREDLKNIFKRFYRIDKARTMNHSYGLGLSIADSILKEHGGRIWAESNEGVNTFFVQLNAV